MTKKRTDGDGSVYQRHATDCDRPTDARGKSTCKCRWQGAWISNWRVEDGKRRPVRHKVTGKTQAEAAAKLRDLRDRLTEGDMPTGKQIIVAEWMDYWFTRIAPRRCKPHTLAGYRAKVDYIKALLGHHRLDRLTPEHIEDAWDYLLETGHPIAEKAHHRDPETGQPTPTPLAPNTVHQTHRILSRALKVAVQRKRLRANPAGADSMDAPPMAQHDIKPMTDAEVDAVLDECRGKWNAARWSVALALGLRQGEALGLRWEDVDLDAGELHVRQTLMRVTGKGLVFGTPKSETSKRSVAIPDSLLSSLRTHRAAQNAKRLEAGDQWQDTGLVFTMDDGRPIDPGVDYKRWRALLEAAGVRHYRLHDARHSAGTMMLAQGVDVRVAMATLGHSSLAITMRYQHTVDEMKKAAALAIDGDSRWA